MKRPDRRRRQLAAALLGAPWAAALHAAQAAQAQARAAAPALPADGGATFTNRMDEARHVHARAAGRGAPAVVAA
jgi:hypothetical protein